MSGDIAGALAQLISQALFQLSPEIGLAEHEKFSSEKINLERPKNRAHGDYASSISLAVGKTLGENPRSVAEKIIALLQENPEFNALVAKVEIAGPGFINFHLNQASQASIILQILAKGENFGECNLLTGEKINLEFVSANPTGPLHLGHTRWAALGDSLGRILRFAGAEVKQEFYINDRGVQMDLFGKSLLAAALGEATPEDGYHGEYIKDLAAAVLSEAPGLTDLPRAQAEVDFRDLGYRLQLQEQKDVLADFRTHFDIWFSEKSLYENEKNQSGKSQYEKALDRLKEHGHVYEEAGATWLRTTDFGDDKDRVIEKSDGSLAYFASDCAYYDSKRERGFTINIYLLGADHHGYVGRLKAIAAARGDDPNKNIEVLIGQLVKIMEAGEEVKLSKRAGTIITLAELVEKVGVDAARYTLIRFPYTTPMVLDVDLLRKRTNENPVFYVQYAHARISQILKSADELRIGYQEVDADLETLTTAWERELIGKLAEFPSVCKDAAEYREPHRIPRYIEELATTFHRFYTECRILPLGDEAPTALHSARLLLAKVTAQVIANGLELLGVSAPEKM
jgi:arginyl-tRNA synthetase